MAEVLEVGAAYIVGVLCGVFAVCFFVGANSSRYVRIEDEEDD